MANLALTVLYVPGLALNVLYVPGQSRPDLALTVLNVPGENLALTVSYVPGLDCLVCVWETLTSCTCRQLFQLGRLLELVKWKQLTPFKPSAFVWACFTSSVFASAPFKTSDFVSAPFKPRTFVSAPFMPSALKQATVSAGTTWSSWSSSAQLDELPRRFDHPLFLITYPCVAFRSFRF